MNNFIKNSLVFVAGFASGVAATYWVATHYLGLEWVEDEQEGHDPSGMDDNDSSLSESDANTGEDITVSDEKYKSIENNKDFVDYTQYANEYVTKSNEPDSIKEVHIFDDDDVDAKPEIIPSNEYGIDTDYSEIELRFYLDSQLITDDWDIPLENMEDTVGPMALPYMCENPDATLYVRNDRLKAYYEIVPMSYDYPGIPVED